MATKTLLLLRHSKSSWDDPRIDDHDRPLNARGRKAATRIGSRLNTESVAIDLVLCSTSIRTRETARLAFAELTDSPAISYRDDLYHASPAQIVDILSRIPDQTDCVMVIGHNPGLEEFLARLTGDVIHFPTAGLAIVELNIDGWSRLNDQTRGQLTQFWRPREMDAD